MKTPTPRWALVLVPLLLLASCAPAETPVPPTATTAPTETQTPVPTSTPTQTPTPTATPDLRVIDSNPEDLVLQVADLPEEGQFVVEGLRGILSNDAIVAYVVAQLGPATGELARAYVEESNRTTGYGVAFARTNPAYLSPVRVYHEIAIFEGVEGALEDIQIFKPQLMMALGREPVGDHPALGDATNAYTETIMEYGTELRVYLIEFAYRNTANEVAFWGLEGEYTLEDAFAIAELALQKLEQAPLAAGIE